jgi:hypothetical protein
MLQCIHNFNKITVGFAQPQSIWLLLLKWLLDITAISQLQKEEGPMIF